MASTFIPTSASVNIRQIAPSYSRVGFDSSMTPLMAVTTAGGSKEYSTVSSVKKAEKATENYINSSLAKVQGVTDSISGYTDTYFRKTSIVSGLTPKSADLSAQIMRSKDGTYSYLVDKSTGNVSSWEWDGFKVQVPSTIVKPLEAVQSIISTIKTFISFIKTALNTLKNLIINLTDIMKAVIDSAVTALTSILDIFRVDASMHLLAVPPIVPKFTNKKIEAQYSTASSIVTQASKACSLVSDFYSNNGIAITVGSAGNKGVYDKIMQKISDSTDSNRPLFASSDYIAGAFILVGGGLEYVLDLYRKLAEIFSVPYKKSIDYLPKAKNILEVSLSIDNSVLFISYRDYTHDRSKVKYSERYKVIGETSVIILRIPGQSTDKAYGEVINLLGSLATKKLVNTGSQVYNDSDYISSVTSDLGEYYKSSVWVFPVATENVAKTIYQAQIRIAASNIPDSVRLQLYIHTSYAYIDSDNTGDGTKILNTVTQPIAITSNFKGSPFIDYGKGMSVGWVRVAAAFDLIPALGYIREIIKLVSTFLNSFLSDIGTVLDSIIRQLSEYLDYINSILTRINSFIDLLKSLAGIGAGAAISVFQGYGGNDVLKLMIKDMLISNPNASNSSSGGTAHSIISSGAKTYFGPNETAAGLLLVAGSEQLDAVVNMVSLIKTLFMSDSRDTDGYTEALGIAQSIGSQPVVTAAISSIPEAAIEAITGIPGGYSSSMNPAVKYSDVSEDYCNII